EIRAFYTAYRNLSNPTAIVVTFLAVNRVVGEGGPSPTPHQENSGAHAGQPPSTGHPLDTSDPNLSYVHACLNRTGPERWFSPSRSVSDDRMINPVEHRFHWPTLAFDLDREPRTGQIQLTTALRVVFPNSGERARLQAYLPQIREALRQFFSR